jgi:hypothetical protein
VAVLHSAHLSLPLPVGDQVGGKINALHDATTELGIFFLFQTAFRCELKDAVTGKVIIVNVPLAPTRVFGPLTLPRHGRLLEGH